MKTSSKVLVPVGVFVLLLAATLATRKTQAAKPGAQHSEIPSLATRATLAAGPGERKAAALFRHTDAPIAIDLVESETGPDAVWAEDFRILTEEEANDLPNPEDCSDTM